jgi:hypothetical protein
MAGGVASAGAASEFVGPQPPVAQCRTAVPDCAAFHPGYKKV